MGQSSTLPVKGICIVVITFLEADVNIHVFICSISVLFDFQVRSTGPHVERFLENLSLFFLISYVICERFYFVCKILLQEKKKGSKGVRFSGRLRNVELKSC